VNERQEDSQEATKVTIDSMEEHLVWPTKTQTMIQDFMANMTRDMKTISINSTSHTTSM